MIRVLDVSKYQGGQIDWVAVAKIPDVLGVYVEATVGNDGANPLLAEQLAGAREVGLAAGIYVFAEILPDAAGHPNRDPVDQVRLALQAVGGQIWMPGDLPPMLDCEDPDPSHWDADGVSPAFASSWIATALDELDRRFECAAGVYTYRSWWNAMGGAGTVPGFASRRLWFADYSGPWNSTPPPDGTSFPSPPAPWGVVTLWQHGDKVPLPGGGPCDGSVFNGTEAAWGAFLGLPPSAIPTVPEALAPVSAPA
jgi:GH25 family lysozyme M1 (1,4-beta-N-acetylmuramidase)